MYNSPTVFVLGAGASWHYGYPTGESLVEKVKTTAARLAEFFRIGRQLGSWEPEFIKGLYDGTPGMSAWQCAEMKFLDLKNRLEKTDPIVIDYFLGHNTDLSDVGRFLIAWVILESEQNFQSNGRILASRYPDELHIKDNWMRFVMHKILLGASNFEDICANKIRFITFNYDVSLETEIFWNLSSHNFLKGEDPSLFLKGRVFHVYGAVRSLENIGATIAFSFEFQNHPGSFAQASYTPIASLIDAVASASKQINVIDPDTKGLNQAAIQEATSALMQAESIYF